MFTGAGYFDESDDNDRAYAVAGFFGHHRDCTYLQWEWEKRILKPYNLEYFKASELNYGTKQFRQHRDNPEDDPSLKFSKRERDLFRKIKKETINIFLEFELLIGIGAVLILPDYYRLVEEYKITNKVLPAPYFFCAQLVMMESGFVVNGLNDEMTAKYRSNRYKTHLRPVFDSHEEYAGRATQMFSYFAEKNPICSQSLLPPHYEDEKQYIALQAADNLAYECRRLLITEEKNLPERLAMTRLKERIYKIYKLDYDSMRMIMENQTPDIIPVEPTIYR